MKFKINNHIWYIYELDSDVIKRSLSERSGDNFSYVFGYTDLPNNTIYLNADMKKNVRKTTLMHELMHCYLFEYSSIHSDAFNEEELCDISANSHDMIEKIVNDYFKGE